MKKKLKILLIMLFVALIIPVGITFSKYAYTFIDYYLIKSNNFYFNSDKLGNNVRYDINNWGGVDNFIIQIQLNNHKNNLLTSDADISYTTAITCSDDVVCSLSSTDGIIYESEMTDNLSVSIVPQRVFNTNETVEVHVTATSTSPFSKTLSATFYITVGRKGIDYEIVDEVNRPYLELIITNARDNYKVKTAFGDYSVGDEILSSVYRTLSSSDKAKCSSADIELTFDPNIVVLDTTSEIVKNMTYDTTPIGGVNYINNIEFSVNALSSNKIKFYKNDVTEDYTYPFANNTSVISMTVN